MQFEYSLSGKWLELLKQVSPEPSASGSFETRLCPPASGNLQ